MAVTGRFAPSPSGRIHLGNILCCLLAWLSARQKGGRVILRIEDLDIARCPRRYGEQMCRDIQWLGLDWDEGPVIGGPSGPYEQSRRTALYQAALRRLEAQGLVYPCFCTRAELHAASAPHREDGQVVYPGTCRGLTAEQAAERARRTGRAPAVGAGGGDHFHRRPHGGVQGVAACGLRGFSAAAVGRHICLSTGGGGG